MKVVSFSFANQSGVPAIHPSLTINSMAVDPMVIETAPHKQYLNLSLCSFSSKNPMDPPHVDAKPHVFEAGTD